MYTAIVSLTECTPGLPPCKTLDTLQGFTRHYMMVIPMIPAQSPAPTLVALFGAALIWAAANPTVHAQEVLRAEDFAWLEGSWRNTRNGSIEAWRAAGDDVMRGMTYINDADAPDGRRVIEEVLLYRSGQRWFYVPDVSHNALPVPFALTDSDVGRYRFDNLGHDYPKRIEYQREGETGLVVTIADVRDDGSAFRETRFHFVRD